MRKTLFLLAAAILSVLVTFCVGTNSQAETVRTRVRLFDITGVEEVSSVAIGDRVLATVFVQDVRPEASGVFSVYTDVLFDDQRLSVVEEPVFLIPDCGIGSASSFVRFSELYSCGIEEGSTEESGRLDGVGAFSSETSGTTDEVDVFSVVLEAKALGRAVVIPESTTDPDDPFDKEQALLLPTLVFGSRTPICPNGLACFGSQSFEGDSIVINPSRCGDFDVDGDVDTSDQLTQTVNWTGALSVVGDSTFQQGDCDADGDVDSSDRNRLVRNWTGAVQGAGSLGVMSVPEPSGALLSTIALSVFVACSRRKNPKGCRRRAMTTSERRQCPR